MKNGLRSLLINLDDGATSAARLVSATAAANAAVSGSGVYPADYFDTVEVISTGATIGDPGDALAFFPTGKVKVEGA